MPFRRSGLPNELREIVAVFVVACKTTICGKVKLIPPCELSFWRQWVLAGFNIGYQITAYGDEGLAALRPEHRDNIGRARTPVKAGEDGLVDLERIHQGDDVDGHDRLLAIADRAARKKARRAIASQIRDDHPVTGRRQQRSDIDITVN